MISKISSFFILMVAAFMFMAVDLDAQTASAKNVDPKKVDVSALSDQQILTLMSEIEKRGWTETQAISVARARGMSQLQIEQLRKRMMELKSKRNIAGETGSEFFLEGNTSKKSSGDVSVSGDFELSEKAMIFDSTKIDTRIFGFQFFNNEKLTFDPSLNIPVSPNYILGPGDEILVDIWGISEQSYMLSVDRNGVVIIPQVGPVTVGGITLEEGKRRLTQALSRIYSDLGTSSSRTFANIYLSTLKAIKINVIGEVFVPGTYTLPGTASVFHALYLSGGPNKYGSFRDIQVLRNGKKIATLDVYDFLINGNSSINISLQDNDVVLVPPYVNRIKAGGEFKREGLYEGKADETIEDVIRYFGGFKEEAYRARLELYRATDKQRQLRSISQDEFSKVTVQNGDSLFAGKILDRYENKVALEGAVFRPGLYELTPGMTLRDIIGLADGLREDAFMNRGQITRLNKDLTLENLSFNVLDIVEGREDIVLQREDVIRISSISDLRELRIVEIFGEVNGPGKFDYQDKMTLADLIFKSGGFKESATQASIEVARRLSYDEANEFNNKVSHTYRFDIDRDLKLTEEEAGFVLQPFDRVYVRRAPSFTEWGSVRVTGEVRYAGEYSLSDKEERISDLVKRTGGLSPLAFPHGAMLTRVAQVSGKNKRMRDELIRKEDAKGVTDIEFDVVGIDLVQIMNHPGTNEDLYLRAGDELYIPRQIQTVKISGEVLNPLAVGYKKGKGVRRYINQGGGFSSKAKRSKVYVINANGVAEKTRNYVLFKCYPEVSAGSEVVVPTRPERQSIGTSGWIGIASSLASIGLTIATIASLNK